MSQHQYKDLLNKLCDHDPKQHTWQSNSDLLGRNVEVGVDIQAWRYFKWRYLIGAWIAASMYLAVQFDSVLVGVGVESIYLWIIVFPIVLIVTFLPSFAGYIWVRSIFLLNRNNAKDVNKYISFSKPQSTSLFGGATVGSKASMERLYEAYFACDIDFKGDLLAALEESQLYANFRLNWHLVKFFFTNLVPELLIHSRSQDRAQVQDHYNRGNDFFRCFLGETMIYTCAVFANADESLEDAQTRKLNLVCKKLHLQPGQEHLDLGCGWGTLVAHASRYYGTKSRGVTLAKEQVQWGESQCAREPYSKSDKKVSDTKFFVCDYRDREVYAPKGKKFNAISCLEMSEHVGVKLFQSFLCQVYDMLEDDGLFYLQIAGLRRSWTFGDLVWGLFMDKYIFPGADASAPLFVVSSELEKAGFEIHSVENVGVHYSMTIYRWYLNWMKNQDYVVKTYGMRWYRIWLFFLAWSTIISRKGRSTAYQIICHKNVSEFDRSMYVGEQERQCFFEHPTKTPR